MRPRFVPAEEPDTYMAGGVLKLAGFSRPVTITCEACHHTTLRLKLLSDSIIGTDKCEILLTDHLNTLGWTRLREGGADICPSCASNLTACEYCRGMGNTHLPTCPTRQRGGR